MHTGWVGGWLHVVVWWDVRVQLVLVTCNVLECCLRSPLSPTPPPVPSPPLQSPLPSFLPPPSLHRSPSSSLSPMPPPVLMFSQSLQEETVPEHQHVRSPLMTAKLISRPWTPSQSLSPEEDPQRPLPPPLRVPLAHEWTFLQRL